MVNQNQPGSGRIVVAEADDVPHFLGVQVGIEELLKLIFRQSLFHLIEHRSVDLHGCCRWAN